MKIAINIEAEILQIMDDYWSRYLKGDLETWAAYLPNNYHNIGTAKEEIWNSKQDLLEYINRVSNQMVGMVELCDKTTDIIPMGPYFMVHEVGDIYVKAEEGMVYYTQIRLSSLLDKNNEGWKILHQHGSYPDSKADKGEAFGLDELKLENEKLRDVIKSRTIELERKNRDLKLEAALERVRAEALVMKHTSELQDVVNIVSQQLQLLAVDANGGVFIVINEELDHDFYMWGSQGVTAYVKKSCIPFLDHPTFFNLSNAIKNRSGFMVEEFTGEERTVFFTHLFKYKPFNMAPPERQRHLLNLDGNYTRSVTISEHTSIFMINNMGKKFSDDDNDILKRFGKVFEQTYARFLELQKAEEQTRKIGIINEENEHLLHSILPQSIAAQIKTGHQNIVKRFESVSILFADIVGFTLLSDQLIPGKIVDMLNGLFSKFDDLTDELGLEKIKTIGDAYMVAAGVPLKKDDHAFAIFRFAQEILLATAQFNLENNLDLKLRIGINSGPVVAGVIGKKKFSYDLWGDTVNTASRMESYGQVGRIQISSASHAILKNDFKFEKISNIKIKGKGLVDVYLWRP